MAVTFSCPECGKVLKSSTDRTAGSKIKCPTCAAVFAMPGRAPVERRSGCGLAFGAAFVLLLVLGGGAAAYYFLYYGVNRGGGNEDPLAFVPAESEVLVGVDYAALLSDPALGPQAEKAAPELLRSGDFLESCHKETGLEVKELLGQALLCTDLDTFNQGALLRVLVGGTGPEGGARRGGMMAPPPVIPGVTTRPKGITVVLRTSRPFDQKKVVRACNNPVHRTANGKSYYDISEGELRTLFMPSDRTLILSTFVAGGLGPLFASDGTTPAVSADAVTLARGVSTNTVSVVIPFEGYARRKIDEAAHQGQGTKPDPMRPVMEQVARGKGAALWAKLDGEQVQLGVNVLCDGPEAATAVAQGAEKGWGVEKAQINGLIALLKLSGRSPQTVQLLNDLQSGVKFAADGPTARMTAALGRTAVAEALAEGQAAPPGGGRGGRGR